MAISLTVRYTHETTQRTTPSYGLLVEAIAATDMPKQIFVIQRGVPSATDPEVDEPAELDQFQWIASPIELQQYAADAPDIQNGIPFYRTDSIRLSFRSMTELTETLELIKQDIYQLVEALKAEETIDHVEEVVYD